MCSIKFKTFLKMRIPIIYLVHPQRTENPGNFTLQSSLLYIINLVLPEDALRFRNEKQPGESQLGLYSSCLIISNWNRPCLMREMYSNHVGVGKDSHPGTGSFASLLQPSSNWLAHKTATKTFPPYQSVSASTGPPPPPSNHCSNSAQASGSPEKAVFYRLW